MKGPYTFGPHLISAGQIFLKTKHSLGLVNLKPILPGHVLVISRRNVPRFLDLNPEEVSDMFQAAQRIGRVIEKEYGGSSLTIACQDGPAAGQTVPHCHVHVIPRRLGDYTDNDDIYDDISRNTAELLTASGDTKETATAPVDKKGVDNDERVARSAPSLSPPSHHTMLRNLARPALRATQRRCASTTTAASEVPLANLELRWKTLSATEQGSLAKQLEQLQAGDWAKMTLEQKKAAYWVAFGPHGARTPLTGPNHTLKVLAGTSAIVAAAGGLFLWIRSKGGEVPSTMTKEWQEASNEYARANKINPISGISSENYQGTGFVSGSKA